MFSFGRMKENTFSLYVVHGLWQVVDLLVLDDTLS